MVKSTIEEPGESWMKTLTAKDAKYGFGRLIDLARAEPVTIAKRGHPVVVVTSIEEYEPLTGSVNANGGGNGSSGRVAGMAAGRTPS